MTVLDGWLQRYYRVQEFTADPHCLLRIAVTRAKKSIVLQDGTHITPGDLVGELHLWNEHLPRFPPTGPTFQWARHMRQRTIRSLSLLVEHVEREAGLGRIRAFYADVPVPRHRSFFGLQRMAARYGFECVPQRRTIMHSVRDVAEYLLFWGLAMVHNPAALRRQPRIRRRQRIWISRADLAQRYGMVQERSLIEEAKMGEKVQ